MEGIPLLKDLPYFHYTVNHSVNFVDLENRNIHTNNIERLWRSLKEFFPQNIPFSAVANKLKEFAMLHNFKKKKINQRFNFICELLKSPLQERNNE